MRLLIIDRDELNTQLMKSKLEPLGHHVVIEPDKNHVVKRVETEPFDMTFIDPSPLNSARSLVLNIRRAVGYYPYIVLLSENGTQEDALKSGANDILHKPIDIEAMDRSISHAKTLINLIKRIGDTAEDFPSAGGVIAKSAFNQLFLSGIDRGDRYGERSFVLFISLSNYNAICDSAGQVEADFAAARLAQHLVLTRRQSDIIGQTARNEYALLLQRPNYDGEPADAAKRFVEAFERNTELAADTKTDMEITIELIDLPIGASLAKYTVTPGRESAH